MSDYTDTLNRILARSLNTAVPIRTASSMSYDPTVSVGIATIKIVTEEQIQALAFGPLNATPTLILRPFISISEPSELRAPGSRLALKNPFGVEELGSQNGL